MAAKVFYDDDADLSLLKDKTIAILGYGSQGHAQAQNLRDSGCNVVVGQRPGSANFDLAVGHGFEPMSAAAATAAGDLVDILDHDQEYQGSDVYNIDEYKAPQLSGGEHAWDLITRDDQAIASGLYLFTVKNLDNESLSYGKVKEGKFLIIK